ncbi:MAG: rhodanese-like domain-containing protein [Dehalococcoidia bacterium]
MKKLLLVLLVAVLAVSSLLTACVEKTEFGVVKDAITEYLPNKAGELKATDLYEEITSGEAPYIADLRSQEHYATGHIPGAINVDFSELATLPKDESIVVHCYAGQKAEFGASVLGILGYNVRNLTSGMSSWSTNPDVYYHRFEPDRDQGNYEVETTANEATETYSSPELDNTSSDNPDDIIAAAAATVSPQYITAAELSTAIAEGSDMTIIDLRKPDHYATGHIPGAIPVDFFTLTDNLDILNPDAPVYVYCYTGSRSGQTTALLQMLGYDAYSLLFGACAWSPDESFNAGKCFDAASVPDYEVEQ